MYRVLNPGSMRDIKYSLLQIQRSSSLKAKPNFSKPLAFGSVTTDHLLEIDWEANSGWGRPLIKPYGPFSIDPCTSVLHYATECFEGMKAYSAGKNQVNLFRPEMNMRRLGQSAESIGLPDFNGEEFLECLKELIRLDKDWIPNKRGFSVYIRPTFIGTHIQITSCLPEKAKLFVVVSPVGPYFPEGFVPVNLYCDEKVVRSWIGGTGCFKVGGNYGPAIAQTAKVKKLGYHQHLWLSNGFVTEMGTMNFFCLWVNENGKTELVTSPLDSTILPGVTRDSILQVTREWNEFEVTERPIPIKELVKAIDENRVIEIFGSGTACIVTPVAKIFYEGEDYTIPMELGNSGKLTKRLEQYLLDIQHGEISHKWAHPV